MMENNNKVKCRTILVAKIFAGNPLLRYLDVSIAFLDWYINETVYMKYLSVLYARIEQTKFEN